MSGHSHWHTIRFKKGVADAKKSKIFSKLAREISIAARDGGADLTFNPKLRTIIEKAKAENMTSDSIDRAIKKGSGGTEGCNYEEFTFEAYGPSGTAIIIEGITDNKNRSIGEIKILISQHGGKMVEEGAIKWMFDKKGVIIINKEDIKDKEELELLSIESGAENFEWQEEGLVIYTKPDELDKVKNFLHENKIKLASSVLEWVPKENIEIDETTREKNQKLFESLDDNDDVQNIYSNFNL
ncbi:MAG: YebC/PmpR family DNA-binding transcriptional regulator [Candidatus Pacebacteria bacterium]|jgi:YebC/PmpR family DNA-binding regulatory protein|nr:YebC/PmpR family DNA-binding transcriptional regulator [Candidatus Paceibacterota bacterium]MDD5012854.1 YebC/PmpR family DNA-binding transcriptional regulator [Candidatus Paceibacterota bacterium]MDD5752785.1 YebC/PmpR family DNA-binding transcriptional regulator [Candidatus Paceibacterota bacterium]